MEGGGFYDDDQANEIASEGQRRERQRWVRWGCAAALVLLVLTNPYVLAPVIWSGRQTVEVAGRALAGTGRMKQRFVDPMVSVGAHADLDAAGAPARGSTRRSAGPAARDAVLADLARKLGDAPCVWTRAPDPAVLLRDGTLLTNPRVAATGGKRRKLDEDSGECVRRGARRHERVQVDAGGRATWLDGEDSLCLQHALDALAGNCDRAWDRSEL